MTQKCIYTNCTRYATYNNTGEKKRIYCSEHKKENMVDVAHKRCIYEGCMFNCCERPTTWTIDLNRIPLICWIYTSNMLQMTTL